MSAVKHTPGPWHFRPSGHLINGAWIVAENGTRIANVSRGADKPIDQKHADGLLIAAAPDLYEALDSLASFVSVMIGNGPDATIPETITDPLGLSLKTGELMRDVCAALARARGEP